MVVAVLVVLWRAVVGTGVEAEPFFAADVAEVVAAFAAMWTLVWIETR